MILVLQKIKVILGLALCAVGIAGTMVPIIPGIPILLAGIALIGADHPLVRNLKDRLTRWRVGKESFCS
ncbi:MAG TPA: hypothetical protein VFQ89_02155 [Candidatus Binatia bacterium]|nr:hypothetical protein [Candidatus Binatia bacterium]